MTQKQKKNESDDEAFIIIFVTHDRDLDTCLEREIAITKVPKEN
jgi:ABC-type lipoprotein export system ATPase subunit